MVNNTTGFYTPDVQPGIPELMPAPRVRRRPTRRKQLSPLFLLIGIGAGGILLMMCMISGLFMIYLSQERVPEGVTVAGVEIGGKSPGEAAAALQREIGNPQVTAADGDRTWTLTWVDLGIGVDYTATVERAAEADRGAVVQPVLTVDLAQAQNALVYLSDLANIAALPAENGSKGQVGRALDIPVVLDRLRVDASGELADGRLDLPMFEVPPPEPETISAANYDGPTTTHVVERGQELGLIAKLYGVSVADIVALNEISNPDVIYVGQELTIPANGVYAPSAADAPAPSTNVGRAITVSISQQRIFAWQDGQLVHSHLVSTGLPQTPTVLGDYNIYVKYVADDMSGPDYFLPQVPYTMYFYQGYAIHGTYWHNSFGRPMSHGCVNLPVDEAEWFFNFAQVGTPVRVVQ